jgi:hypothetical protein
MNPLETAPSSNHRQKLVAKSNEQAANATSKFHFQLAAWLVFTFQPLSRPWQDFPWPTIDWPKQHVQCHSAILAPC